MWYSAFTCFFVQVLCTAFISYNIEYSNIRCSRAVYDLINLLCISCINVFHVLINGMILGKMQCGNVCILTFFQKKKMCVSVNLSESLSAKMEAILLFFLKG